MDKYHPAPGHPLARVRIFGVCDHGLYSGGTITTPGAVAIPLGGDLPANTALNYEQSGGDSIALRVPGTPPVVRTPEEIAADTAAGRTWLDYGIIAGGNRVLYGKALGARSWVYAAADGSRWLIELVDPSTSGATLTAKRFGEIPQAEGEPAPAQTIVLSMPTPAVNPAFPSMWTVDDVDSSGAHAAVCAGFFASVWNTMEDEALWLRYINRIYEVSLSGVPPAMSASVTFKQAGQWVGALEQSNEVTSNGWLQYRGDPDANGVDDYLYAEWTIPAPATPPGFTVFGQYRYPVGDFLEVARFAVGACYDDDVFRLVTIEQRQESTRTAAYDPAALAALGEGATTLAFSGTFTATTRVRLYVGETPLESVMADSGAVSGTLYYDLGRATSVASDGFADLDGTTVRTFLNAEASNYTANNIEGSIGHFWFWPSRLSNRAWSLVAVNLGSMYGWANGAGPHYQVGVASPVEQPRLMREIADLTGTRSALHGYATAHPVTGEVEWSEDGLCCWV